MSIKQIGSRWFKFDFHTHSPASSDYKQPTETATDWLKALMTEEVDCVAITDHVSGEWIDTLKSTYAELDPRSEWYRPLYIFPGCEITVSTGQSRVHILAIFDPNCNAAKITAVLGQCGITDGHGDAETTFVTKSIDSVIDIIADANGIAIPAHIDGPKGLLYKVTNSNQEIERWLAKIEAAEFINLSILDSVNNELQSACTHLAKLKGSDAHECAKLGKRYSWIKMGIPSIGGLKLALHDHTFCVDNSDDDPNTTPDLYLTKLKIAQMNHCGRVAGQPAEFDLHPLFNAIIGGRGSGKSTFIESVRLALGRDGEISDLPQIKADVDSFKQGVTKADTTVMVHINRRNESYQSVWQQQISPYIKKSQENDWVRDNGRPQDRFHVSLYSQKQINALATNTNSLLEIIDRSTEVNYLGWKHDYDVEINLFLDLCRDIRKLKEQLNNTGMLQAQLDDLNSDIENFEQGGHKEVFNAYQKLITERKKIENISDTSELISAIDNIVATNFSNISLIEDGNEKPEYIYELETIQQSFKDQLIQVQKKIAELKQTINDAEKTRKNDIKHSNWYTDGLTTEEKYQNIVEEYKEKGDELDPRKYEIWLEQRNILNSKLAELNTIQENLDNKQLQRNKSLKKLYILRRKLQKKRQIFINTVLVGNKYVKMKLYAFAGKKTVEQEFRSHIGVESSYATSIYQDDQINSLLFKVLSKNSEFKTLIRHINELKKVVMQLASGKDVADYRIDNRLKTILAQKADHQPEALDRLLAWWPEDQLVVEYAKDIERAKFENIEKGSAGQKAAAILAFLLSHGDNPIIVDQPEDDLDNALIYQLIVSQIHENKKRRQIIMVTHNPNIVVNGDAEFVNVLNFRGGQVQLLDAGGLCEQSIRDHVCNIMEGGSVAFDKRYKRLREV